MYAAPPLPVRLLLASQVKAGGPTTMLQAALQDVPGVVKVSHLAANSYALEAKQDLRAEAARALVEAGSQLWSLDVEELSLDEVHTRYFQEVKHVAT